MKNFLSTCIVSVVALLGLTAFAGEVYGPVNPFMVPAGTLLIGTNTTSFTPSTAKTTSYPAAQLGFNVPYVTFEVYQVTTNSATSNVVYTLSGSMAGTNWTPLVSYTLALTGTTAAKGFTNIPQSVIGGYRYLGLTAVQNVATNYVTITPKLGFWHLLQ